MHPEALSFPHPSPSGGAPARAAVRGQTPPTLLAPDEFPGRARLDPAEADRRLMERVSGGDEDAFRRLFDAYWDRLVAYAAGILGPGDEAQDVVLQAFVRVWSHRAGWRGSAVSAYLYRVTRNLAINARRDGAVRDARQREADVVEPTSEHHQTPARRMEGRSLRREVEAAIAALPERRRETFVLSRYHGLTHDEIAQVLGVSPQTVANQVSAAMADLRRALGHHLGEV